MLCTLCWLPLLAVHLGQLEKRALKWHQQNSDSGYVSPQMHLALTGLSVLGVGLTWSLEGEHKKSFLVLLPANPS